MGLWIGLVVLGVTVWVTVDAARLGATRGALGGGFLDMGPVAWFFSCAIFWWAAVPCYLVIRPRLVRRARAMTALSGVSPQSVDWSPMTAPQGVPWSPMTAPPVGPAQPVSPTSALAPMTEQPTAAPTPALAPPMAENAPPGYYPNPDPAAAHGTRWWDGQKWADDH